GEGLTEDEPTVPPPSRPAEPQNVSEPEQLESEQPSRAGADFVTPSWAGEPSHARTPHLEPHPSDLDEPRGRIARAIEPFEPDLPPSRTQRSRVQPQVVRPLEFEAEEEGRSRTPAFSSEVEPTSDDPDSPESRRSRPRQRPGRPGLEPESP